jgi:hypothetical protein
VRAWSWSVSDPLADEFEPVESANDLGRGMVEKLTRCVREQVTCNVRFKVELNLSGLRAFRFCAFSTYIGQLTLPALPAQSG